MLVKLTPVRIILEPDRLFRPFPVLPVSNRALNFLMFFSVHF